MAIFGNIPLFITLTVLCCFLPFYTSSENTELATQICKNATDPTFCRQVFYSDPQASTAGRVVLAYTVFGTAYLNATNTQAAIQLKLKATDNGKAQGIEGLKGCLANYTEAVQALSEVLGNLDSELYAYFDILSIKAQGCVLDCKKGLEGHALSLMKKENEVMMKLTDICNLVANLFPYND